SLVLSYIVGSSTGVHEGGIYGTAIATIGMLATAGFILAMDNFGPITDNAGGIVEMSGGDQKARAITDKLDAAGNTTKAITKGYAIGSAALAAFLLFSAYLQAIAIGGYEAVVNLADIKVFVGGFLGAMLVLWFSSLAIRAVGTTAQTIVEEVRRQFRDIEGIMTGKGRPDYGACVDIAAKAALKEMVAPGLIVFFVVLLVGKILGPYAAAAVLMVGTITGILFAMTFNNSGGAWDNAKKYIESGNLGGKGSDAHKAAVVGDTVGDPFKDTAGPSLHVLIKLLGTITLVLAPIFL
ncbi:sodium/proton-translocating pyrophosphatase, partial [Candidatus Woesearchaeota archaeon]|nr:sodium/proton-translocating pyrophosphatase [Candidatus Woesearchaeota archaeon]